MSIEMFREIKKELVNSKNKMEKLCSIMRKHKVKMSPRVKNKLRDYDHILDEEYETIQINFEKSNSEDVPIKLTRSRREKKSEVPKITKKITKKVYEVRNLTILKNPKNFLERLAKERHIWPGDVMHRISMDVGDDSLKVICNTFSKHQDNEIFFTHTEYLGNLLSGVKRSIVLAYCEGIQENNHNLRVILELLEL